MKLETLGVWMGFPFETSLRREGITRFIFYLVKHLLRNYKVKCEIWCYDINYDEIYEIFNPLLSQPEFGSRISIFTEKSFSAKRESRKRVFTESFEVIQGILRGESVSWKHPFSLYARAFSIQKLEIERLSRDANKRLLSYAIDTLVALSLLASGAVARGIRNYILHNRLAITPKMKYRHDSDPLANLANEHSKADVFLIQIVNLDNGLDLKSPRLLYLPDLVTLEFYDLFVESYSNIRPWIDKGVNTAKEYAKQAVFFCSNSDYVRKNHILRFIPGVKEVNTGFVYLPANIPDNVMNIIPSKATTFKKYSIGCDYIFYPTQIRPYKNVITLLKAFLILKSRGIPLKLVLTGNTEEIQEVTRFISTNEIGCELVLTGGVAEVDLYALHKYAIATVVPTLFEGGFPWQALEAMLMDTPVVLSRIPAVTERLIHEGLDPDNCGLRLFEPCNENELAEKIIYVYENRQKCITDQSMAKEKLFSYNWDDVAHQYYRIFSGLHKVNQVSLQKSEYNEAHCCPK